MHLDRTNAYTRQYAAGCKQVAEELGLPVVDLWSDMQQINVRLLRYCSQSDEG